jgi:hypothetical protein
MGRFLLHMLRIEYEKRQAPIANLSIADANFRLKEQIRKFLKAAYPFDRDLHPGESAYQWWVNLDQDRSNNAQPLAVCNTLIEPFERHLSSGELTWFWFMLSDLALRFLQLFRTQWLMNKPAQPLHGSILISATASRSRH